MTPEIAKCPLRARGQNHPRLRALDSDNAKLFVSPIKKANRMFFVFCFLYFLSFSFISFLFSYLFIYFWELHSVLNNSLGVIREHNMTSWMSLDPEERKKILEGWWNPCQIREVSSGFSWSAPLRITRTGRWSRRERPLPQSLPFFLKCRKDQRRGLETLQSFIFIRRTNRKEGGGSTTALTFWITWNVDALPIMAAAVALSFGDMSSSWIVNFNFPVGVQMVG